MLSKKDRRAGGMTAPAHGLVLWKVFYPPSQESGPGKQVVRLPKPETHS